MILCGERQKDTGGRTPIMSTSISSGLSEHLLLRFGFDPLRWCELLDLGNLGRRQAREQILQIIERIDSVPPATAQQSINHRAAFSRFGMPDKQPVLFSKC